MHRAAVGFRQAVGPLLRLCNIMAAIVAITPAAAATLTASADLVSDYRFRGVSLSDRAPVGDATAAISAGAWTAGIEAITGTRTRSLDAALHRNAEIDLSAAYSRSLGLLTPSVGAIGYLHPGGGSSVGEVFASVAGALGPGTLTVGANLAPAQGGARGGNLYLFAGAAAGIPLTPLTLHARIGREAGVLAGGARKIDYAGGVEARVARILVLGLDYVGSDLPTVGPGRLLRNREDGIVVRAGVRF